MSVSLDSLFASLAVRIEQAAAPLGDALLAADPGLQRAFEYDSEYGFALRAFATFVRRLGGDELAVTVEVQIAGGDVRIDSDIFTDGGVMVALGPSLAVPLPDTHVLDALVFDGWVEAFATFLRASIPAALAAARQLT